MLRSLEEMGVPVKLMYVALGRQSQMMWAVPMEIFILTDDDFLG